LITARKTTTWVLALGLLLALCVLTIGKPASAEDAAGDPSGSGVQPILVDGNPNCATLPDDILPGSHLEYKIEGAPTDQTYGAPGSFQVTITNADGKFFDWSSLTGVDAVIVKGGNNADAFVYDLTAESNGDTLLHAPLADNGQYRDISHVSFCYDGDVVVPKPLTATKTATGSYDRTITWDLTKTVDPASHSGEAGDSFDSKWTVTATKNEQLGNYKVEGNITIKNPNGFPVDFSVTDELDDTTVSDDVDCSSDAGNQDSGTVPAKDALGDGSATCTYSASPPNKSATSNTADVTSNTAGVLGTKAEAAITWNENVKGDDEVTLADLRFDGFPKEISSSTTEIIPETFDCSSDPSDYEDGKLSYTEKNTATLKGVTTDLSKDAEVKVDCVLPALTATKTATGSYDRKITWDLTKTVTPPGPFNGKPGDSFNANWNVNATKNVVDNNHKVTGDITISNPSAIAQNFSVSDLLDDGTAASVDCDTSTPGLQTTGMVPAGGNVVCGYTASTAKATLNTATVKAAGNSDVTATAPVSYTANVIGDTSVTLADERFSFSQLISGSTPKTFPEKFKCPTDRAAYDANHLYTQTFTNTATLKGLNTNLERSASVTLNCTYPWQGETATGAGTRYPGTSNWFMYTAFTTNTVNLIAGQNIDAGDITMTRYGGNTYITVTLASGFRFANVKENLKIQDFANAPTKYLEPGQFKHKFSVPQGTIPYTNTYTAKIPGDTAKFYGIHANVEH
jgi:hypothetical protein